MKDILIETLKDLMPSLEETKKAAEILSQKTGHEFSADSATEICSANIDTRKEIEQNENFQLFVSNFILKEKDTSSDHDEKRILRSDEITSLYRTYIQQMTGVNSFRCSLNGPYVINLFCYDDPAIFKIIAENRPLALLNNYICDKVANFLNTIIQNFNLQWAVHEGAVIGEIPEEIKCQLTSKAKFSQFLSQFAERLPIPSLICADLSFVQFHGRIKISPPEIYAIAKIAHRLEIYRGVDKENKVYKISVPHFIELAGKKHEIAMPKDVTHYIGSFFKYHDVPKIIFQKEPDLSQETFMTCDAEQSEACKFS